MEFGLFSHSTRKNTIPADSYDQDLAEIIVADKLGFAECWVAEHLASSKLPVFDSLTVTDLFVCKAAALTQQIRLGPAVRSIAFHHPLQLAIDAATCDQL